MTLNCHVTILSEHAVPRLVLCSNGDQTMPTPRRHGNNGASAEFLVAPAPLWGNVLVDRYLSPTVSCSLRTVTPVNWETGKLGGVTVGAWLVNEVIFGHRSLFH